MKATILTSIIALGLSAAAGAEPQKVDAFNFVRAETDRYFDMIVKRNGGLGILSHERKPLPPDARVIVRINRDTLYSSSIHDLAAGPVKVSMPENPDGRYQTLQVISQDHFTPFLIHEGTLELTQENVGTRYVLVSARTFLIRQTRPTSRRHMRCRMASR
ncbi:DUF1254 domain-containing protein [Microbulbifer litoralis]|uniref:DUF1254 domain-containing protein n=1 Tax=Microbulbifer litoralis TaxID=2933965 RepID=UPI0020278C57|nr:DUF1254 domain-containing protein [Microbulbifer sp. GX H0434]